METATIIISVMSFLGAYLVGSIPSGYVLVRLLKGFDIRQHGSGNIGASNVARVLGKRYFIIVFLVDFCKAWGTLIAFSYLNPNIPAYSVAFALLLGNAFSVFLCFSGGKGVATSIGIMAFFYPWWLTTLFSCSWLIAVWRVQKPFLASLISSLLFVTVVVAVPSIQHKTLSIFLVLWVVRLHMSNIKTWL